MRPSIEVGLRALIPDLGKFEAQEAFVEKLRATHGEKFALEPRFLRFAVERFRRRYKKMFALWANVLSVSLEGSPARSSPMNLRPSKLVECPYEVRIDRVLRDQFYDVRDAMAFARIVKQKHPTSRVIVVDARTGKLVIEVER
ncbi:hypothetical protein [Methylocystis sp.]|uniref:hypothetical protein n=1 Tax=Methylocystis sp. TaxID=1911079 RepID=UPI003DA3B4D1